MTAQEPEQAEPQQAEAATAILSPAAYRSGLLLALMARAARPMKLTELAAELGLPKSSISNLLGGLAAAGIVRHHTKGWILGYRALELTHAVRNSTNTVAEFRRIAASLPTVARETSLLATLDGTDVIYIARNDGNQPVRFMNSVGSRMPAAVTGLGKVMLANLEDADLDFRLSTLRELPTPTVNSHRTIDSIKADLMEIRSRGYSIDNEEGVIGVTCFAVSVHRSPTPTAVSVTMLKSRATPELQKHLTDELRTLAAQLREAD